MPVPRDPIGSSKRQTADRSVIPAFEKLPDLTSGQISPLMHEAVQSWLQKSTSEQTQRVYLQDFRRFLVYQGIDRHHLERLLGIRPEQIAEWRDTLLAEGLAPVTVRRKLTTIRSLYSYLQAFGYTGANPAHSKFVAAPKAPRDGKTPGLTPKQCRRLLDAPDTATPIGIRDRALLAVLAYSACRVGELVKLKAGDFTTHAEHRILHLHGKGGKERIVALHPEAVERLQEWTLLAGMTDQPESPLFQPSASPQRKGRDGFLPRPLTTRQIEKLVKKYAAATGLDPRITVHSLRVTALTTARERGCDIVDLQDFAGHSDPRTTLAYIRNRNQLTKSPTYVLGY